MIHWHGLTPPSEFDGVPDLPMPLLAAGEQRGYRFPIGPGGTHWMHAHTLQEQAMLAAPLIVRRAVEQSPMCRRWWCCCMTSPSPRRRNWLRG